MMEEAYKFVDKYYLNKRLDSLVVFVGESLPQECTYQLSILVEWFRSLPRGGSLLKDSSEAKTVCRS